MESCEVSQVNEAGVAVVEGVGETVGVVLEVLEQALKRNIPARATIKLVFLFILSPKMVPLYPGVDDLHSLL